VSRLPDQIPEPHRASLNRKAVLKVLSLAGGGLIAAKCTASARTTSAVASSSSCAVTPEGEIGPFFTDDSLATYNRSNILSNLDGTSTQTGVPLTLTLIVRDGKKSCAVMSGVQVDIWHCNAQGVYSNESVENTVGQTWLRGYQITNSAGAVTFATIVPGWYQGRTTHIHLRVRSSYSAASSTSDGTNTTQVFFPQSLVERIGATVSGYRSHGVNTTTNANDHVYTAEVNGVTLLNLSGSVAAGYTASYAIALPITAA
jgi:protocatechuate 3,4-dioxygenase beta subunit